MAHCSETNSGTLGLFSKPLLATPRIDLFCEDNGGLHIYKWVGRHRCFIYACTPNLDLLRYNTYVLKLCMFGNKIKREVKFRCSKRNVSKIGQGSGERTLHIFKFSTLGSFNLPDMRYKQCSMRLQKNLLSLIPFILFAAIIHNYSLKGLSTSIFCFQFATR